MNEASLPDLTYRDLIKLIKHFSIHVREKGPIIVGKNRLGQPFTVHQHPSQKCHKAKLSRIIKSLGINREQFWDWHQNER